MKELIIFGAGASFGSDSMGVPPLGNNLFGELETFAPRAWGALTDEQKLSFRNDFEEGMKLLGETNSHALPPLQRAMALYFFRFQPKISNLYYQLAERIKANNWTGSIATINYERLLEISLLGAGIQPVVSQSAKENQIELCFPHGCCHIFCEGIRASSPGVSFSGTGVSFDGRVTVISDPSTYQSRIISDAVPPVMSYFQPDKNTSAGRSFVNQQRSRFNELVSAADKIAIIGMRHRAHDSHIWEPLKKTTAEILYCSGSTAGSEYKSWANINRPANSDIVLNGYFSDHFDDIVKFIEI